MAHDRFDECHSFNLLGFIQLLYDTTCLNLKPVWGLGCIFFMKMMNMASPLPKVKRLATFFSAFCTFTIISDIT